MTDRIPTLTRRRVLGCAGSLAAVGFGSSVATGPRLQYTQYTYADTGDDSTDLHVAWYSTYNGTVQNETPGDGTAPTYEPTVDGPLVHAGNVLPGDSGTVSIGLRPGENPVTVTMYPLVEGRLAEAVEVAFWEDAGVLGFGGCAGAERRAADVSYERTLSAFDDGDGDGHRLLDGECLAPDSRHCFGFAWQLPATVDNEMQRASVEFGLQFVAEQCEGSL